MSPSIAAGTQVDRDELTEFIEPGHKAPLITRRGDGSPQASPVTCGVDAQGRIVVSTCPERAKARNARRDERVSVVVRSDDFNGPWVRVDGTAEVVDGEQAVEPLVEHFRAISREHPDREEYRQAMRRRRKALLRITPRRRGPVATGGLPAHRAPR